MNSCLHWVSKLVAETILILKDGLGIQQTGEPRRWLLVVRRLPLPPDPRSTGWHFLLLFDRIATTTNDALALLCVLCGFFFALLAVKCFLCVVDRPKQKRQGRPPAVIFEIKETLLAAVDSLLEFGAWSEFLLPAGSNFNGGPGLRIASIARLPLRNGKRFQTRSEQRGRLFSGRW